MTSLRARLSIVLLAASTAMCGGDPESKKSLQEQCYMDEECESGKCALDGVGFCTQACTDIGKACDIGTGLICGTDKYCHEYCEDLQSGPDGTVCAGGIYVACSSADPALTCQVCGCESQGGGICVEGMGCLQPVGLGMPCVNDELCTEGVCDPETKVCATPRPMGEPCFYDTQCQTKNCSNDGATGSQGVCNQKLGSYCMTKGAQESPTCTRCIGRFVSGTGTVGTCRRADCDEVEAPCGKGWECMSTQGGGGSACFQNCDGPGSLCEQEFATCQGSGPYAVCL